MQPVPSLFLTHSAVQGGPDVCWTREPAFGSGCEPRRGGMRRKSKKESACTRKNTTLEAIPGLINMWGYAPATWRPPVYGVENVRVTTSSFSSYQDETVHRVVKQKKKKTSSFFPNTMAEYGGHAVKLFCSHQLHSAGLCPVSVLIS